MSVEIKVPVLGESVVEATVAKWMKASGEAVKADEAIVELETDKVTLEVPSPVNGVLSDIVAAEGVTVGVDALLGLVEEGCCSVSYGGECKDTCCHYTIGPCTFLGSIGACAGADHAIVSRS